MWRPDYCTLDEFKSYLQLNDSVDDDELALAISAASRAIDKCCNRQFGNSESVETRQYLANHHPDGRYLVNIDDLNSTVGLVVSADSVTLSSLEYKLTPLNAAVNGEPFTVLESDIKADSWALTSNHWGWVQVPTTIKQATLIQGLRFFKRRESPFGVAGSPDMGSELRLLNKLDPDVALMVAGYRKWWAAA